MINLLKDRPEKNESVQTLHPNSFINISVHRGIARLLLAGQN